MPTGLGLGTSLTLVSLQRLRFEEAGGCPGWPLDVPPQSQAPEQGCVPIFLILRADPEGWAWQAQGR